MNTLIEKEFDIEQPIDVVWKSLADPEDIVTCVPGAAITEKIDDQNYKGEVVTKFGPIKAKYAGDIEIVELDEANYKMVLKGRGLDSKGKGSADMIMNGTLTEADGKTNVKFSMDITIVGMLAQFGSRLINDVSDQLLNQFVANFRTKLMSAAPTDESGSSPATATEGSASASTTTPVTNQVSEASAKATEKSKSIVENTAQTTSSTQTSHSTSAKATEDKVDNSFDGTSLIGTVIKSIFGSIGDFFKSLFGGKS